jgi:hypothetical protein
VFGLALVDRRGLHFGHIGALREAVEDEAAQLVHVADGHVEQAIIWAGDLVERQCFGQGEDEVAERIDDLADCGRSRTAMIASIPRPTKP